MGEGVSKIRKNYRRRLWMGPNLSKSCSGPFLGVEIAICYVVYLVQLIEQPITNPEFLQRIFCLFTIWVFLQGYWFFIFYIYWHFWLYCDINLKLLLGNNTQKVNKQKIRCKNSGLVNGCSMSWTRYINTATRVLERLSFRV